MPFYYVLRSSKESCPSNCPATTKCGWISSTAEINRLFISLNLLPTQFLTQSYCDINFLPPPMIISFLIKIWVHICRTEVETGTVLSWAFCRWRKSNSWRAGLLLAEEGCIIWPELGNEDWHVSIADDHAVLDHESIVDVGFCIKDNGIISRYAFNLVDCSDDADAWPLMNHQQDIWWSFIAHICNEISSKLDWDLPFQLNLCLHNLTSKSLVYYKDYQLDKSSRSYYDYYIHTTTTLNYY